MKPAASMILLILMISCTSAPSDQQSPSSIFDRKIDVVGKFMNLTSESLNAPVYLVLKDSLLIIHDRFSKGNDSKKEYLFKVFNRNTGEVLRTFGRIGRGPDEFFYPSFINRLPGEGGDIGIYNPRLFTFTELSIDSILFDGNHLTINSYKDFDTRYSNLIKLNQNLFLGTGHFLNGRYALTNTSQNVVETWGEYPFQDTLKVSDKVLGMAFQTKSIRHPHKPIFVSVTYSSANFEIIQLSDQKLSMVAQINSYPPYFEDNSSGNSVSINLDNKNRWGYQDVAVTDNFIYALYSGKKKEEDRFYFGDQIFVFDWNGNPISQLNLSKGVFSIAVDNNDKIIYALTKDQDQVSKILIFPLGSNSTTSLTEN